MTPGPGVVTGLAKESHCLLEGLPFETRYQVLCAGARPAAARDAARFLLKDGCRALVSFGVAGGLAAGLNAGTLVLADSVISGGKTYPTDPNWHRRIAGALTVSGALVEMGPLAGLDEPVLCPDDKARLAVRTGAVAVDMESAAVAAVAAEAGVPFLVVRAVADPWNRAVPTWLPGTIGPDGRPLIGRVMAGILANPADIPSGDTPGSGLRCRLCRVTPRRCRRWTGPSVSLIGASPCPRTRTPPGAGYPRGCREPWVPNCGCRAARRRRPSTAGEWCR